MNQQDKNNEILRLLNCLEPYTSEFKSMQRDIEFALQTFGKIHQDSYVSVIHLISEEKEKNKKNNFVRQDTVTSINDLYATHKGIKCRKNILIYRYTLDTRRETRSGQFSDIKFSKNEQESHFKCWRHPT